MQVTAYKCPVTGALFEDAAQFAAHQQILAKQQDKASRLEFAEARRSRALQRCYQSTTLDEVLSHLVEHYNAHVEANALTYKRTVRVPSLLTSLQVVDKALVVDAGTYRSYSDWHVARPTLHLKLRGTFAKSPERWQPSVTGSLAALKWKNGAHVSLEEGVPVVRFSADLTVAEFPKLEQKFQQARTLYVQMRSAASALNAQIGQAMNQDPRIEAITQQRYALEQRIVDINAELEMLSQERLVVAEEIRQGLVSKQAQLPEKDFEALLADLSLARPALDV